MGKKITTEKELKSKLKVKNLKDIPDSPVTLNEFVNTLPQIDANLASMVIEQFPEYQKSCLEMLNILDRSCDRAFESSNKSQRAAIESYSKIVDGLERKLDDPNLSEKDRKAITRDMIYVSDRIATLDQNNKKYILKVLKIVAIIVLCIACLVTCLPIGLILLYFLFNSKRKGSEK